jgi:hypothetical protein
MNPTEAIESRIEEIEQRQRRFVLAGDGDALTGAWTNYIQGEILAERTFQHAVIAEVIATLRREFEEVARRVVSEAMEKRIRGTWNAHNKYELGDVVALDGGSFMAKFSGPGGCPPGPGWQLVAKQGQRGVAGPKGERGQDGARISGWRVDSENFTIQPIMSDGGYGPPIELRSLFQEYNRQTTT